VNLDAIRAQVDRAYEDWLRRVAPDPKRRAALRLHQDIVNAIRLHVLLFGCEPSTEWVMAKMRGCITRGGAG